MAAPVSPDVRAQYMELLEQALGEQEYTKLLERNSDAQGRNALMNQPQMLNTMPPKLPVPLQPQESPWAPNQGRLMTADTKKSEPWAPNAVIPDLPAPSPAKAIPEAKTKQSAWDIVGKVGTMLSAGFAPHMYPHLLQANLAREEAEGVRQTASIMVDVGRKTSEGDYRGAMDTIGKAVGKSHKLGQKGLETLTKAYGDLATKEMNRNVTLEAITAATKVIPQAGLRGGKAVIIGTFVARGGDLKAGIDLANTLGGPKVHGYDKDRGMLVYDDGSTAPVPGWKPEAPKVTSLGDGRLAVTPGPGQPMPQAPSIPGSSMVDIGGTGVVSLPKQASVDDKDNFDRFTRMVTSNGINRFEDIPPGPAGDRVRASVLKAIQEYNLTTRPKTDIAVKMDTEFENKRVADLPAGQVLVDRETLAEASGFEKLGGLDAIKTPDGKRRWVFVKGKSADLLPDVRKLDTIHKEFELLAGQLGKAPFENVVNAMQMRAMSLAGVDNPAVALDALQASTLALAKTFQGAAAQLSDKDVAAVSNLIPNVWDSEATAKRKLSILKRFTRAMKSAALGEGYNEVSSVWDEAEKLASEDGRKVQGGTIKRVK